MPTIHAPLDSSKHPENGQLESTRNASYECTYWNVSERLFGFHIHLDEAPNSPLRERNGEAKVYGAIAALARGECTPRISRYHCRQLFGQLPVER